MIDIQLTTTFFLIYNAVILSIFILIFIASRRKEEQKIIQKLRKLNEMKSDFFWMTAHQLRTPLTNTRWHIELLIKDQNLSEETKQKISKIQNGLEKMTLQINEILKVSRTQHYELDMKPQKINISATIEKIIEELNAEIQGKYLDIDLNLDSTVSDVIVAKYHFEEVLENLISNAVKYNKIRGSIKIVTQKKNNRLIFQIKDTGIGIPQIEQSKMFSKFFRATNVKNAEGTGLGLSVIKAYIEGWNGKIWFESKENEGSVFYFDIPIKNL